MSTPVLTRSEQVKLAAILADRQPSADSMSWLASIQQRFVVREREYGDA